MKKIYYLLAFMFSICTFGTCMYYICTNPFTSNDFIIVLILALISCGASMIFGYAFYAVVKENAIYDRAALEQAEKDWYYHEQLCAEQLFGKSTV